MLGLAGGEEVEFVEGRLDIAFHAQAASVFQQVPFEINSHEACSGPISCDFIVTLERREKVEYILFVFILYGEVIHTQSELDGPGGVFPESRGMARLIKTKLRESLGQ